MNQSTIKVRLDEEYRTAELELSTPNGSPEVLGIDHALRRMGLRPVHTVEFVTPKYRVTRTKVAEMDGSEMAPERVMQLLQAAQSRTVSHRMNAISRAA